MNTITLLDRFTYAGASGGDQMYTPWVNFPSDYRQAELWIDVKTFETGTITIDLESSIDTTSSETANTAGASGPGVSVTAITSKLGPLVRLKLSNTAATARGTVSVWLVPKQD